MLGRKQSIRQTVTASLAATAAGLIGTGGGGGGQTSAGTVGLTSGLGDPGGLLGPGLELEECIRTQTLWWESQLVRRFMRFCAFLSLVSVSLNTSYTFSRMHSLLYITFLIDLFVTLVFTVEFISKVRIRGWQKYARDRWAQFDAVMLACLIMSLVLHVFEILGEWW